MTSTPDHITPVEAALAELSGLDELDIAEHPERFDRVHQLLREELTRPPSA